MPLVIENAYHIEKTIIIGTTGSMWDNLYEIYWEKFRKNKVKDEEYKNSLIKVQIKSNREMPIEKINIERFNQEFNEKVKGIVIRYGVNSKEISRNFDLIIKLLEEFNDTDNYEVFLDITHSFRSMAFWMFLVMNYLTDVSNKNIKIAGITYGMYEAKENDITPIVILEPFLEILDWIKGASELKKYGNSYHILNNLKNNKDIPETIKVELENFSNAMNTNYVGSLLKSLDNLANLEKNKEIDSIVGPAKHIIPDILKKFIKDFDIKENNDNRRKYLLQATLAKWHFEQKRYAMAAININEALANYIANSLNLRDKDSSKFDPNSEAKNWLRELYNITDIDNKYKMYAEVYHHTRRIRSEIAHSLGNEVKIIEDIKLLENFSEIIINLLKNENTIKEAEKELHLLDNITENTALEKNLKVKENKNVDSTSKSILILSTRALTEDEKNELKRKLKLNKIYTLKEENTQRWRNGSEKELTHLKRLISEFLKEGDYILIHGNYYTMTKIYGYANTKKLKPIFLSEKFSPNDEYFKEI